MYYRRIEVDTVTRISTTVLNGKDDDIISDGFGYHRMDGNRRIWSTFSSRIKLQGTNMEDDIETINRALHDGHGTPHITLKNFEDVKYTNYTDKDCYEEVINSMDEGIPYGIHYIKTKSSAFVIDMLNNNKNIVYLSFLNFPFGPQIHVQNLIQEEFLQIIETNKVENAGRMKYILEQYEKRYSRKNEENRRHISAAWTMIDKKFRGSETLITIRVTKRSIKYWLYEIDEEYIIYQFIYDTIKEIGTTPLTILCLQANGVRKMVKKDLYRADGRIVLHANKTMRLNKCKSRHRNIRVKEMRIEQEPS